MKKTIHFALFDCRYTYQYYNKVKGAYVARGKPIGEYGFMKQMIYLEGEEDKVWEEIKKFLGDSESKRITFTKKEIRYIQNTGKTNK